MEADPRSHETQTGHWTPYFISSDPRQISDLVGRNIIAHSLEHKSGDIRPLTVEFRSAALGGVTLHEMAYSMYGSGEADIFVSRMSQVYLCEINRSGDMVVGQKQADTAFPPDHVYMINANAPHAKIWRSDGRQVMIQVHQKDMEAAVERLTGAPLEGPVLFDTLPRPVAGAAQTLDDLIRVISADLEQQRSFFALPAAKSAADMIIEMMLHALPNSYSAQLDSPAPLIRPRHVRHAAQFVHVHARDSITLDQLVAASGVSPRSLHAGFRKYYGVPPMTYLRNVRLDLARQQLTELSPGETSVTKVALNCGFSHLGKFSGAYKARFGELPSQTLRGD